MGQVLADPRMVDYLIQSQPQLQAMGPGIRQYMQSEEFRRNMTDPNMIRNMFEMNRMFAQMGMQVPGMPPTRPQANFPAPGVTNTTPTQHQHQQPVNRAMNSSPAGAQQHLQQGNPFEAMFPPAQQGQGATNATNPFIALFPTAQPGVQPPNPFGSPPPQVQGQPQQQQSLFGGPPAAPLNPQQGGLGPPYPNSPPPQQQQQQQQQPFGQNQQPHNMASMYSMLQNLQSLLPPGGVPATTLPGQTGFVPPGLQRPAADNRPIEERYQVPPFLNPSNVRMN
jgi:ubiquilin